MGAGAGSESGRCVHLQPQIFSIVMRLPASGKAIMSGAEVAGLAARWRFSPGALMWPAAMPASWHAWSLQYLLGALPDGAFGFWQFLQLMGRQRGGSAPGQRLPSRRGSLGDRRSCSPESLLRPLFCFHQLPRITSSTVTRSPKWNNEKNSNAQPSPGKKEKRGARESPCPSDTTRYPGRSYSHP